MLFNSMPFLLVFLPATLLLFNFFKQRSNRAALALLLAASLIFYSWWDWRFTPLLLSSIAINYAYGRFLDRNRTTPFLALGIVLNLAPLVFFKYAGWLEGMFTGEPITSLVLPLGISFFTFLQIGYLVNIRKGTNKHHGFLPYSVFVTYFPHLIAGPILKHDEVVPQLLAIDRNRIALDERFAKGMLFLLVGLFKKVIIADAICADMANSVFAAAQSASFIEAWTGALAYTCQLYFDFSGYCEMAFGMSLMLGITIPVNFLSPYRSTTIAEFWRTWHISLGTWFREHVYVPLGGSRHGLAVTLVAIAVTFFLTGLWHGAGWTFVLWGCLHGLYLATYRIWAGTGMRMPVPLARFVTLMAVVFAWILFRASNLPDALQIWQSMLGFNGLSIGPGYALFADYLPAWLSVQPSKLVSGTEVLLYGTILGWCAMAKNVHEFKLQPTLRHASLLGVLAFGSMMLINRPSEFLYFSF